MVSKYVDPESVSEINAADNAIDRGFGDILNQEVIEPNINNFNAAALLKLYQSSPKARRAIEQSAEHISMDI